MLAKNFRRGITSAGILALAFFGVGAGNQSPRTEPKADHRDSPTSIIDPAADINDFYAFVNPVTNNVVLVMTVNPFQAPGNAQYFSPDVLYQFKIDNTGDFNEDLVIQFTFDQATTDQHFTMVGPVAVKRGGTINSIIKPKSGGSITGPANGTVVTSSDIKVFAGLRDDPFFFDLTFVERLIGILPGGALTRNPGIDYFAGFNVSAIAVEIPSSMIKGKSGNSVNLWATTSRSSSTKRSDKNNTDKDAPQFVQIQRMGRPAIKTVLVRSGNSPEDVGALKDEFNRSAPADDVKNFTAEITKQATALNNDATYSAGLAKALLPDVLGLDVTSTAGFLNGRRPQDDVIDAELNLLTKGAVTSDGVNANDVPFLGDFPFLAPPHSPTEGIPVRE